VPRFLGWKMALAGTKGLSSEDKLRAILNGPNDPDDDDEILLSESRAKEKLRRTSLYGKGAKFSIPKVKKKTLNPKSPFVAGFTLEGGNTNQEKSAVPPGAHDEQYRIVQYNTKANLADPDRVWYATSSMREGLNNLSQPPWYYGNQNKTKPADCNLLTAAARYGFRGSKDIRQFHTKPYEPADRTTTVHTPHWLRPEPELIDEWVPPLFGGIRTSTSSGAMFMSPKMWPKTAEFVNGYTYKEKEVTSAEYTRQTTAGQKRRPKASEGLKKTADRRARDDEELIDLAHLETFDSLMSVPKTAQATFQGQWGDTLDANATGMLKATMKHHPEPFEAHKLVDETDCMKYSGSTAFIVRSQSTDELKFRLRMERANEVVPYMQRWRQVISQFKLLKLRLKRDQGMGEAIQQIGQRLKLDAKALGQPTVLPRMHFIKTMHKISFFEHVQPKQVSLLYSVFDHMKKDTFRFVDFLVSFTILDCEKDPAISKLASIWRLNEEYGNDRSVMEMALTVLLSAVGDDQDEKAIRAEFKDSFRSACYQNVILSQHAPGASSGDDGGNGKKVDTTAQPAYNICDDFLNRVTFVDTLQNKCPKLVALYDEQLSARLVQAYGKDSRIKVDDSDEGGGAAPPSDFTWIIGKK